MTPLFGFLVVIFMLLFNYFGISSGRPPGRINGIPKGFGNTNERVNDQVRPSDPNFDNHAGPPIITEMSGSSYRLAIEQGPQNNITYPPHRKRPPGGPGSSHNISPLHQGTHRYRPELQAPNHHFHDDRGHSIITETSGLSCEHGIEQENSNRGTQNTLTYPPRRRRLSGDPGSSHNILPLHQGTHEYRPELQTPNHHFHNRPPPIITEISGSTYMHGIQQGNPNVGPENTLSFPPRRSPPSGSTGSNNNIPPLHQETHEYRPELQAPNQYFHNGPGPPTITEISGSAYRLAVEQGPQNTLTYPSLLRRRSGGPGPPTITEISGSAYRLAVEQGPQNTLTYPSLLRRRSGGPGSSHQN